MPLEVDFLRHFGWRSAWIRQLQASVGSHLLPIQDKAIRQGGLFDGNNLVVVGPTSCGKGLVGELAGLHQVRQNRRGLLIVPTKALARQRWEQLRERYTPLGLHIVQSSRDHREADREIAGGSYHLAIVVAEKLLSLLSQHPQMFSPVGAVVLDELQTVFDEERGADLELLVTRLLREEQIQMIALSAVIEQPTPVAQWLKAQLVEEVERPVELRQGVLTPGVFHYHEFNSGRDGRESFSEIDGDSEEALVFSGARFFAERGEMTLIFCAGKDESFAWAEKLASALALPPAEAALSELDRLEDNLATEALRRFLASRVAVHNSDLTWPQRRLVEKYASRGDIRVLCSTSTLSEGVNLPIVNTFIPRTVYHTRLADQRRGRPPRPEPISQSRFRNMTGRSGRLGQAGMPQAAEGEPFGRGLLVSPFSGDREPLMRLYLQPAEQGEPPRLLEGDLAHGLLKLVATGSARSAREIAEFLGDSLSGRSLPPAERETRIGEAAVEAMISTLSKGGFLAEDGLPLEVTPLGLAAARSGTRPETLEFMREYARSVEELFLPEVLLALAFCADGQAMHLPLRQGEWKSRRYPNELFRRLDAEADLERPSLQSLLKRQDPAGRPFALAVKKTLLLLDWISPLPTVEIERRYRILSGHIEKVADGFSWLAETLAEVGFIEGWDEARIEAAQRLTRRLKWGLPSEALGLARLYERGLSRTALLRLQEAALDSIEAVEAVSREELTQLLGRSKAEMLYQREEVAPAAVPPEPPPAPVGEAKRESEDEIRLGGDPPLFVLNRLRPDRLLFRGCAIALTEKQFELLWVLAGHAGQCVAYDRLMDRLWPDCFVEQQQISSHKSKILQKVRKACGRAAPALIRTIRGRGLVLETELLEEDR